MNMCPLCYKAWLDSDFEQYDGEGVVHSIYLMIDADDRLVHKECWRKRDA